MQLMICKCNLFQESVLVSLQDLFLSKGATTYTLHVAFIIHMNHEPYYVMYCTKCPCQQCKVYG